MATPTPMASKPWMNGAVAKIVLLERWGNREAQAAGANIAKVLYMDIIRDIIIKVVQVSRQACRVLLTTMEIRVVLQGFF